MSNDNNDEAVEAIRALQQVLHEMTTWRPIDTAPCDDTPVLWCLRNGERIIAPGQAGRITRKELVNVYRETGHWPVSAEYAPVGWMPLPPPPASDGERVNE